MSISRVLRFYFFGHFYDFKLYKSDKFQFIISGFFSVVTKQGNDSNANLYYTNHLLCDPFSLLHFSIVIYLYFYN